MYSICVVFQVVFGLYDQGFRMEVKLDGPRGTFTILTRDAVKTDKFLVVLRDVLGEPLEEEQPQVSRIRRQFSSGNLPKLSFPDEEKINRLKSELAKSGTVTPANDQHLLMYSVVHEILESDVHNVHPGKRRSHENAPKFDRDKLAGFSL